MAGRGIVSRKRTSLAAEAQTQVAMKIPAAQRRVAMSFISVTSNQKCLHLASQQKPPYGLGHFNKECQPSAVKP
jgi:hypothetical protein